MSETNLQRNLSAQNIPAAAHLSQSARPKLFQDKIKATMVLFILSEVVFFGILITTYIYFQAAGIHGPNAKESLEFGRTLIFSLFLFASSGTIFFAELALERHNRLMTVFWIVVTVVFGAIFLFGQATEYLKLINDDNITMNTNLFGSSFFTMTGFHGLHVSGGLVVLTIMAVLAALGDFKSGHSSGFTAASWYWHFVDVVWVVIFTIVYVIPTFFW